jgi:lysophospholipase L1-like esterase
MRPWRRTYGAECSTLKTWIADLVAANPGVAFSGPDEGGFLENGDDGATYTGDGVHPNAADYTLTASEWVSVLGL